MKRRKCLALLLASAMVLTSFSNANTAQAAKKVKLSKSKVSLQVGKTTTVSLNNVTKKDKKKVKWSISNKKVATVTVTGKVNAKIKAKKKGTANLVAKIGKKKYTCKITVTAKKAKATTMPTQSATAGAVTTGAIATTAPTKEPWIFTAAPTQEVTKKPVVVATETPTETPIALNTPFEAPVTEAPKAPAQTVRPAFIPDSDTVISGGNVPTVTTSPIWTLPPAMESSNRLLVGATSTDSSVQGISVYKDNSYGYIEVFGSFDDIQTVYSSIDFETAGVNTSIESIYTAEAYYSDRYAGYYTITFSGYVNGTYTSEQYILAKFGEFKYSTSWEYEESEDEDAPSISRLCASITGFSSKTGRNDIIVVPEKLNGAEVTSVGSNAFQNSSIQNIILPDTVTKIGYYAFYCAYSLKRISLSDNLTSIGSYAFAYCYALEEIKLPSSLTSIESNAFYYCTSLTGIEFPNSVKGINSYAFAYCTGLDYVYLPETITYVGDYAFGFCPDLVYDYDASGVSDLAFATENSYYYY